MSEAMKILVLDDDPLILGAIEASLDQKYQLKLVKSPSEAFKILDLEEVDGAIIDINLGDSEFTGVDFLKEFKKRFPEKPAIIQSGDRQIDTVVTCMQVGANDYIEKPYDATTLRLRVSKVFGDCKKNRVLQRAYEKSRIEQSLIGNSKTMLQAKKEVEQAGSLRILFIGETGVGKTPFALFSNQVVTNLTGEPRPFEQVNCSALTPEYLQDQLFGHKKGAFTGAIADKRGLVEIADGGDLFLDEIGDMPLQTQALFLTFLDTMEYYRLGDDRKRHANVRILSATNHDLRENVRLGKFRKDLYSRLSQAVVEVPPLRKRPGDIPLLISYFIEQFSGRPKPIDKEVFDLLVQHRWEEGNVRELRDTVERLCVLSRSSAVIGKGHLPPRFGISPSLETVEKNSLVNKETLESLGLEQALSVVEEKILKDYLQGATQTVDKIAEKLKVSRPTFYRRLKKYHLIQ